MNIIAPSADDVPQLQSLMRGVFTETFGHLYPPADLAAYLDTSYAADRLRAEVADPWNFWRMVRDGSGKPVAYLECVPAHLPHPEVRPEAHGEIERIYVLKSQQGKGLGRKLMGIALDYLGERYGDAPQWLGVWTRTSVLSRSTAATASTRSANTNSPSAKRSTTNSSSAVFPKASAPASAWPYAGARAAA